MLNNCCTLFFQSGRSRLLEPILDHQVPAGTAPLHLSTRSTGPVAVHHLCLFPVLSRQRTRDKPPCRRPYTLATSAGRVAFPWPWSPPPPAVAGGVLAAARYLPFGAQPCPSDVFPSRFGFITASPITMLSPLASARPDARVAPSAGFFNIVLNLLLRPLWLPGRRRHYPSPRAFEGALLTSTCAPSRVGSPLLELWRLWISGAVMARCLALWPLQNPYLRRRRVGRLWRQACCCAPFTPRISHSGPASCPRVCACCCGPWRPMHLPHPHHLYKPRQCMPC